MYKVYWTKKFVSGNLKGLTFKSELDFNNLDSADRFVTFLNSHKEVPVDTFDSSDYVADSIEVIEE